MPNKRTDSLTFFSSLRFYQRLKFLETNVSNFHSTNNRLLFLSLSLSPFLVLSLDEYWQRDVFPLDEDNLFSSNDEDDIFIQRRRYHEDIIFVNIHPETVSKKKRKRETGWRNAKKGRKKKKKLYKEKIIFQNLILRENY